MAEADLGWPLDAAFPSQPVPMAEIREAAINGKLRERSGWRTAGGPGVLWEEHRVPGCSRCQPVPPAQWPHEPWPRPGTVLATLEALRDPGLP